MSKIEVLARPEAWWLGLHPGPDHYSHTFWILSATWMTKFCLWTLGICFISTFCFKWWCWLHHIDLKTIRHPDISPAKLGFLGTTKKLKFRTCGLMENHVQVSRNNSEETPLQRRRGVPPVGLHGLVWELPHRALPTPTEMRFLLTNFTIKWKLRLKNPNLQWLNTQGSPSLWLLSQKNC